MSKKFTSFLVLVALWLAIPAQAQTFEAKKAAKQQVFNANKALKAENFATAKHKAELAKVKATDQPVGIAFRGGKHTSQVNDLLMQAFDNVQEEKAALEKEMNSKLSNTIRGYELPICSRNLVAVEIQSNVIGLNRQAQPTVSRSRLTVDAEMVTPPAEATVETWYTAEGSFYANGSSGWQDATADMETVSVAIDGTDIYIQGLAYWFENGWIQGTINGTTATFANGQLVGEDEYGPEYIVGSEDGQTVSENIVFNYNAEEGVLEAVTTYILENSKTDQVSPYCYWISPTFSKNEPAGPEVVTPPAGIEAVDYVMTFTTGSTPVKVAVDGNDVYFQGMSSYLPEAWVKGTKDGSNVTFDAMQYMGEYAGYESYFFYNGATTFVYDAEADSYSATGQVFGVLGGKYYDGNYTDPVLSRVYEIAATPANPEITALTNGQYGWYITFNVPLQDTEGNPLVASKLSYEIFTEVEEVVSPLTFTPATHSKLTEDLTVIPYGFTENYDFYDTQIYLNDLYSSSWEKIGIKSIYTGGGETHETDIQWLVLKKKVEPTTIPFATDFSTEDSMDNFIILDANDDAKTWSWSSSNGAFYKYNSANSADDYLILPVQLVAGKTYDLALTAASSVTYPEKFEVVIGKEASATGLSTVIIPETEIASSDKLDFKSSFSVAEDGVFYVAIHAISEADMNLLKIFSLSIELGAEPTAPAAVTDLAVVAGDNKLEATVSFKAPSKTVAGEDLTANLTKIEILRDGAVIKTLEDVAPGSEQSYVDNDPTLTAGTYVYQVIPYNASGIGLKSDEIPVFISASVDVPYVADFTQEGVINMFQAIDANNDGKTWSWSAKNGAFYSYAADAADDYLVSLPLNLEAGKNYDVLVSALAYGGADYPEAFEVKVGKAVDALNITAIPATTVTNEEYADFEGAFTVTETGTYVVAIHAISEADMWRLQVSKLSIEEGANPAAPAAVSDLAVKAGAEGANEATISFIAPAKTVSGADLTDNLTKIEILRNDSIVNTIENVAAGSAQSWTDADLEGSQIYTYQVIPYNAEGRGLKSDKVSAYVGIDAPADLEELAATDKGTSLTFNWKKVGDVGQNGGFVDPTKVNYEVWSLKVVESLFGSYLDFDEQLGNVVNEDNFDYTFNSDEGDQGYKYWAVMPVNEVGQGAALAVTTLVGASYTLPVIEGFSGPAFHYVWEYADNSEVFVSEESSDDDNVALILTAMDEPGTAWFNSGKIDLKTAANPTLLFDVKSATIKNVNIIGSVNGEELKTISTAAVGTDYTTIMVPLTSLQNGRYAQVGFSADFATPTIEDIDWSTYQYVYTWGDLLTFDNIRIVDLYEHDVQVALNAPASVVAGNTAKLQVKLSNNAQNSANGFTLKLSANDKVFYDKTFDAVIPAFSSIEMEMEYETSIFDEAGDVTLAAEVIYGNDLNLDNNTDEAIITVKESGLPAPTNLVAEDKGEAGVDLAWTAPEIGVSVPETVTIDFESEEDINQFTQIDADGDGFIWNQHINTGSENFAVHGEGNGSIYSESYSNDTKTALTPDNWLVTPRAVLNGTFSFWACGQDAGYAAEHFAVYVSTTSATDPAAFTKVSDEFVATGDMTEYSVDLSSYAGVEGYIAIRHYNVTDMFCLVVDDITFTSTGGATPAPVAFNIYVGRDKIADVEGDKTTYTVAANELTPGEYTFGVSAVYPNSLESKAAIATITIVTSINDIVANGKAVDVYSLDGKLVRRQVKSFDGLKGVYVINGKAVMVK